MMIATKHTAITYIDLDCKTTRSFKLCDDHNTSPSPSQLPSPSSIANPYCYMLYVNDEFFVFDYVEFMLISEYIKNKFD